MVDPSPFPGHRAEALEVHLILLVGKCEVAELSVDNLTALHLEHFLRDDGEHEAGHKHGTDRQHALAVDGVRTPHDRCRGIVIPARYLVRHEIGIRERDAPGGNTRGLTHIHGNERSRSIDVVSDPVRLTDVFLDEVSNRHRGVDDAAKLRKRGVGNKRVEPMASVADIVGELHADARDHVAKVLSRRQRDWLVAAVAVEIWSIHAAEVAKEDVFQDLGGMHIVDRQQVSRPFR